MRVSGRKRRILFLVSRLQEAERNFHEDVMPNIQHNAVCIRTGVPLISCFRWAIARNALPGSLFHATEEELLSRSNCVRHESFVGSYLLGTLRRSVPALRNTVAMFALRHSGPAAAGGQR